MKTEYDAIVIGARCAGSPTAMLLARKGYRVLVVDRAAFPSDTLSTHMIHGPGVAALRRWGLLDQVVATGCPPIETYSFDFGPFTIAGHPRTADGIATAYAPRRTVLDKILVDAAGQAGAEVREGFTVDDIVEPAMVAETIFRSSSLAPDTADVMRRLGDLSPTTLALMHGSSYRGDGGKALYDLAAAYEAQFLAGA